MSADYIYFTINDRDGTILSTCETSEEASLVLERRAKVGLVKCGVTPQGASVPLRYIAKSAKLASTSAD